MNERHLLAAVRYVELNPVRAGMTEIAEDWEWSSARYHLGLRTTDWLVRERGLFGSVNDWGSYLRETPEDGDPNFDLHLRTGRPLGDAEFIERLERFVGKSLRPKKGGWQKGKKRK